MDPFELVDLGRTGLKVTRLGLGGAPLGNPPPVLSDREAVETIRRAVSLGMRYVDTAAYGEGRSELRYGEALADFPRDSYVISTKVGVLLKLDGVHEVDFGGIGLSNLPDLDGVFDFSRDAVLRSLEQSLQRLRLEHVDILFLHVVPREHYRMAIDEGFPTLAELRSQGVVRAVGAGLTPLDLLLQVRARGRLRLLPAAGALYADGAARDRRAPSYLSGEGHCRHHRRALQQRTPAEASGGAYHPG